MFVISTHWLVGDFFFLLLGSKCTATIYQTFFSVMKMSQNSPYSLFLVLYLHVSPHELLALNFVDFEAVLSLGCHAAYDLFYSPK